MRLLLAIAVCAFAGLFMGASYAALTPPPVTATAVVLQPSGAPVPGGPGVQHLAPDIVQISAQGSTGAQAEAAGAAAVRSYLARAPEARLVDEAQALPHHGGRMTALAAAGALVGALAGALGGLARRRATLV
jgi:hypothetical protein